MSRKQLKDESISKLLLAWGGLLIFTALGFWFFGVPEDTYLIALTSWTIGLMPSVIAILLDRAGRLNPTTLSMMGKVFLCLLVVDLGTEWLVHLFQLFGTDHTHSILTLLIGSSMRSAFGALLFRYAIARSPA